MAQYFNCGFGRVAVYDIAKKSSTTSNWKQLRGCSEENLVAQFHKRFQNRTAFKISNDYFVRNARKLLPMFDKKWNPTSSREQYHSQFSEECWKKLSSQGKSMHSLQACKGCLTAYPMTQSKFPGNIKSDKENYIKSSQKVLKRLKKDKPIPLKEAKKTALTVFESISEQFEDSTGHSLTDCLTANPKTKLQKRPTKQQQKRIRREQVREYKQNVEQHYTDSAVSSVLGTRVSKSQYNRVRLAQGFEPPKESKPKSHTPTMENIRVINHDVDMLVAEVESMPDQRINWSALARKYGVKLVNSDQELKNGGQVIKEFLRARGVNVERFNEGDSTPRLRRKRKRGLGGEASIPTTPSIKQLNQAITERLEKGEYDLGELITPREFSKLKLTEDGQFSTEVVTVEGRKIPLNRMRQRLLNKQEKFKLLRARNDYMAVPIAIVRDRLRYLGEYNENLSDDEQRLRLKELETTRYLSCWADHSTIAGHTYVLYMFSCLYDEAVFLSNDELTENGDSIGTDVEELVGQPQIHVIARCGSSDENTLAYAEERRKCIKCLTEPVITSTGVEYNDVLRYFTGDMPALAAECGQQYGGNYPCGNCGSPAAMFDDCAFILRRPLRSLQDRLSLIYEGVYASNTKCRPFATLSKDELSQELAKRNIDHTGSKKELSERLQKELGGVQRVPTLLFNTSTKCLTELGLDQYEITLAEPLHDYSNHVKNLLTEIPPHLSKEAQNAMDSIIKSIFKDKQTIRGCDYRDAAVVLPQVLRDQQIDLPEGMIELLDSLSEIGHVLYSRESQRTVQSILHFHLVTWRHWILLRELLPVPKKLTRRKLWGYYSHALLAHAPLLYRVIATRQLNAEDEERMFGTLKDITKRTSSMRPGEIEFNALIRVQEETTNKYPNHSYDKVVSKHARNLSEPVNIIVPVKVMKKHSHHWQALLENISDYLIEGEGIWWKRLPNGDVEFFNIQVPQHIYHQILTRNTFAHQAQTALPPTLPVNGWNVLTVALFCLLKSCTSMIYKVITA